MCQGVDYQLKSFNINGKANQLKEMLILTILANFMYLPCISERNLFIL